MRAVISRRAGAAIIVTGSYGRHPKQPRAQNLSRRERGGPADEHADGSNPDGVPHDSGHHPPGVGAKCHANADLTAALAHVIGSEPVQTDAGHQQRERPEERGEGGHQPLLQQRAADDEVAATPPAS